MILLIVIALLWRCKTVSESCLSGGFLLMYFAKLLLRLIAPDVSLQHRAGVVSTMRGVMILCAVSHWDPNVVYPQYRCECVLATAHTVFRPSEVCLVCNQDEDPKALTHV